MTKARTPSACRREYGPFCVSPSGWLLLRLGQLLEQRPVLSGMLFAQDPEPLTSAVHEHRRFHLHAQVIDHVEGVVVGQSARLPGPALRRLLSLLGLRGVNAVNGRRTIVV